MSDVDSGYRERLTIEELAIDCLDVREMHRRGFLRAHHLASPTQAEAFIGST